MPIVRGPNAALVCKRTNKLALKHYTGCQQGLLVRLLDELKHNHGPISVLTFPGLQCAQIAFAPLIIAFKTVLTFNVGKNRSVRQTSFGSEIRTEHHENS